MEELSATQLAELLGQVNKKPEFSAGDVAMLEFRLSRFNEIIRAVYLEFEATPASAKQRKLWRKNLLQDRMEIRNGLKFCLRYGFPAGPEIDSMNEMELGLLEVFPGVEPAATSH